MPEKKTAGARPRDDLLTSIELARMAGSYGASIGFLPLDSSPFHSV